MLEESEVEEGQQANVAMDQQPGLAFAIAARSARARLIKKVYEVDPLICPHCGGEMRFLAVIEEAPVIEKILRHIKAGIHGHRCERHPMMTGRKTARFH